QVLAPILLLHVSRYLHIGRPSLMTWNFPPRDYSYIAQTQSESGEERSGSGKGQEVPRVQLHGRQGTAPAHCAESDLAGQGADSITDLPDTRDQHAAASTRTLCLSAWLARLLRLLSDTLGTGRS